jgi:spore germination protein KC
LKRPAVIVLITALLLLPGCRQLYEVDETAYVYTLTLDKGEQNRLKVGTRIPVPRLLGKVQGQVVGAGTPTQQMYLNTQADATNILEGISTLQMTIARRISLEHASTILFSDELAREGLLETIRSLMREPELRSTIWLFIVRGDPFRLIEENEPVLEVNSAKFTDLLVRQQLITSTITSVQLGDFYSQIVSNDLEGVLPILTLNERIVAQRDAKRHEQAGGPAAPDTEQKEDIEDKQQPPADDGETSPPARSPGSYPGGQLPREGGNPLEFTGLAVFQGDKMVGTLNANETIAYNMITDRMGNARLMIPEPDDASQLVVINIYRGRAPKLQAQTVGDTPMLRLTVFIDADIESIESGEALELPRAQVEVERLLAQHLTRLIEQTVIKTQEWGADIFGFGRHYRSKYLTWDEWQRFDWPAQYRRAELEVNIEVKIRRPGLIIGTGTVDGRAPRGKESAAGSQ